MLKKGRKGGTQRGISTNIDASVYNNLSAYCKLQGLTIRAWVESQARKLPKVIVEETIK